MTVTNGSPSEMKVNKNNNLTSRINEFLGSSFFANGLAIILILGCMTAVILLICFYASSSSENNKFFNDIITKLSNKNFTPGSDKILDSLQNHYRESNVSSTNLLSILLPVIGSWIGAILAFYYGNKNLEKWTDTVKEMNVPKTESEKLGKLKVSEILDKFNNYKNVTKAKITDIVGDTFKGIDNMSTVLLTDANDKPLGFLYKDDILKVVDMNEEKVDGITKSFKEFFTEQAAAGRDIIDEITGSKWSGESALKNYAEVNPDDTLLLAQTKMKSISDKQKVRGLVINNQGKIVGVLTYSLFSDVMASIT